MTLELVHGDICGPISPATVGGSKYFLLLVDDYSRVMWVPMIKNKSKPFQPFFKFKNLLEAKKGMKIGCLRIDQGDHFTSSIFFCSALNMESNVNFHPHILLRKIEFLRGGIGL